MAVEEISARKKTNGMTAKLIRDIFEDNRTLGILSFYNDDASVAFQCYTIEDTARALGVKIPNVTCIPEGKYLIDLTMSQRFNRIMPLVYNQQDLSVQDGHGAKWAGIRIHWGNTEVDTDGCIIVGAKRDAVEVLDSHPTFDRLYDLLNAAQRPISFEIINRQEQVGT